jgi:hypothetical protein
MSFVLLNDFSWFKINLSISSLNNEQFLFSILFKFLEQSSHVLKTLLYLLYFINEILISLYISCDLFVIGLITFSPDNYGVISISLNCSFSYEDLDLN